MNKILISWVARTNDFIEKSNEVDLHGANMNVHEYYYNGYDFHLILSQYKDSNEDTLCMRLVNSIQLKYPTRKVLSEGMGINDVINLNEILSKVTDLLIRYRDWEIDIFISPGTSTMQVAWYLAHQSLGLKTTLFQLRRAKHTKNGIPEKVDVQIEKSPSTTSYIIHQHTSGKKDTSPGFTPKILKPIYDKARRIAQGYPVSVLITGETGTGKELLAKYIHECSPRQADEFVPINCSAFGNELLESRLFGYVEGSHSTAKKDIKGLFHKADKGTIFLDEIGDITSYMQQTLLRVLQEKQILRIGALEAETVDVRVIAATNRDLYTMSMNKEYREDLYYRLAVAELHLPPLREYDKSDKEDLFNFLWEKAIEKYNKPAPVLPSEVRKIILQYPFPGNIREMENIIDKLFAESENTVTIENLPQRVVNQHQKSSWLLKDVEHAHIQKAIAFCNGNLTQASKLVGVSYNTMKKYIT